MLLQHVQVPAVTDLIIGSWDLPSTFFNRHVLPNSRYATFPNVQRLSLRDIAIDALTPKLGEEVYVAVVAMMNTAGRRVVELEEPRIAVQQGSMSGSVVLVKKQTRLRLQEMMKGSS